MTGSTYTASGATTAIITNRNGQGLDNQTALQEAPTHSSFSVNQDTGNTAYEIDKQNARFVNVCSSAKDLKDAQVAIANDVDESADAFSLNMSLSTTPTISFDDATETETIEVRPGDSLEMKRIVMQLGNCVTGKVQEVEKYPQSTAERDNFLQGKDE